MLKIGVLGTGFGMQHLEIYGKLKEVEVVLVFGRNWNKLNRIKEKFNCKVTNDINEVISNESIEMIDVCLPTTLHKEVVVKALMSGKHVFCETPITYSIEDANEIMNIAKQQNKKVFVDLFYKFSTPHRFAIDMCKKNSLGKLISFKSYNKTSPVWGDLGILKNISNFHIHNIDFLLETIGKPKHLISNGIDMKDKSIVETVFYFEDKDKIAQIESHSSLPLNAPFIIGYELVFEKGILKYHAEYGNTTNENLYLIDVHGNRNNIKIEFLDDYEEVIKHIIKCLIKNSKSNFVDIEAAVESMKIINCIRKSYNLNTTKLNLITKTLK